MDKARSLRAKADTIANRTKKTITEKMEKDPFFYRKFSVLLEETIADYKAQRISEVQYLERVTEIMRAVRDGRAKDAPEVLRGSDLSYALFGALKEHIDDIEVPGYGARSLVREDALDYGEKSNGDPIEGILAAAASQIEGIIRKIIESALRIARKPDQRCLTSKS